jgi:hypothetical protein
VLKNGLVAAAVFVLFLLTLPRAALCDPKVVYDNTGHFTNGHDLPNGFLRFGVYAANELMGDQVSLAGTDRIVTEFDLALRSSQPTTLQNLRFELWDYDSNIFAPGRRLWATTLANVDIDGNTIIRIDLPGVTVPDDIVWVAGADSNLAGLATCNPPTTGASDTYFGSGYYWDLNTPTGEWMPLAFDEDDPAADFGARILAVPEPATISLVAAGWLVAIRKGRSRREGRRRAGR